MAVNAELSMKVCDFTQCSICLETYKEPKALPCIHTFCLQCLDKYCEDKQQEEVACPLCRKVYTIPPGGNTNLPNNFFILQLLQVKQSRDGTGKNEINKATLCELCSDSEAEIPDTAYCIECDQHICDRCSVMHTKAKVSRFHQVVREANMPNEEERKKTTLSYCNQHPTEQNRIFCNNCMIVTCHVCFVDKHNGHTLTDVSKSAEKFREQMNDDIDNVSACAVKKQERIKQLEIDTSLFMKKIASTENEILQRCDQLISLVQSHKSQLMEELQAFKNKILKEVATEKDEIERQFVIAESFKRYCQEITNKGSACDISRMAHDLHTRAEELLKTQDEPDCHKLSEVVITFKPSFSTIDKNFIGELVFKGCTDDIQPFGVTKFLGSLTVLHVMPSTGHYVCGITVLGSKIFITRDTPQVYVYKSDDFTLIRNLAITGSKNLGGLVSCSHYNCLYICDRGQAIRYRYDLTNNVTTPWSVGGSCYALSVTKCYNVLVTLYDTQRIQEYTTHGRLIRQINLDSSIDQPWHCIQLSTGNYVVCHVGTLHRVCIVDQSGSLIHTYGGSPGSGVGQLHHPYGIAVDTRANVLVAGFSNNKIQLLSPTLNHLGEIVIPGYHLSKPYTIQFDELNHRLYIGEYSGKRMFVIDENVEGNN